ncbi:MAG: site-specific DNA-methyltransferase, partial [Alphaproteobacteria bacterium]|nr:site-specific DNA-methyltransferase [Alphaproteobacteria bacterium]
MAVHHSGETELFSLLFLLPRYPMSEDATKEQLFKSKIKELFQINEPDLDFGFYRIMHMRRKEVENYIEDDLPKTINSVLGEKREASLQQAREELEKAKEQARAVLGPKATDEEILETALVRPVLDKLQGIAQSMVSEADIYDRLYQFFDRYYEDGDFTALPRNTRPTETQHGTYMIPSNGDEITFHWANKDQYYIKSSDRHTNYSFDIKVAADKIVPGLFDRATSALGQESNDEEKDEGKEEAIPLPPKLHFRLAAAEETPHGNVKATSKLYYLLKATDDCLVLDKDGLILFFEHRTMDEKEQKTYNGDKDADTKNKRYSQREQQEKVNALGERRVSTLLAKMNTPQSRAFQKLLATPLDRAAIDTGGVNDDEGHGEKAHASIPYGRTILGKHLRKYTARFTSDFFIHKDLKNFLLRELEFYIKNEMLNLAAFGFDLESPDPEAAFKHFQHEYDIYSCVRMIARDLIAFLAQLEELQKQLWLKKKFAYDVQYCFTLDRVDTALYADIAACKGQIDEWVDLYGIDSSAVSEAFLHENPYLVLDTKHFDVGHLDAAFRGRLLAGFDDLDANIDGVCVHSENFQALTMLSARYREQVQCIYIDPPYNTGKDFIYKDNYKRSSWASVLWQIVEASYTFQPQNSSFFASIDEREQATLRYILSMVFGEENFINNIIWQKKFSPSNDAKWLSDNHDFIVAFSKNKSSWQINHLPRSSEAINRYKNPDSDPRGVWSSSDLSVKTYSADYDYPITTPKGNIITPPPGQCWRTSKENFDKMCAENRIWFGQKGGGVPRIKRFLRDVKDGVTPMTIWMHTEVGHNQEARQEFVAMFATKRGISSHELSKQTPKPTKLISRIVSISSRQNNANILDYFAGSGTTGHAVINLNRDDGSKRKYLLVEMGDYFDTFLLPRLKKAAYSKDWEAGKPEPQSAPKKAKAITKEEHDEAVAQHNANPYAGVSHSIKYYRLESYEDTLNNLGFKGTESEQIKALAKAGVVSETVQKDYQLRYQVIEEANQWQLDNVGWHLPDGKTLRIQRGDTTKPVTVDMIETFNQLLGLRVRKINLPCYITANDFSHAEDEFLSLLPDEEESDTTCTASIAISDAPSDGALAFRLISGWLPKDPTLPDAESQPARDQVSVAVLWRDLVGDEK